MTITNLRKNNIKIYNKKIDISSIFKKLCMLGSYIIIRKVIVNTTLKMVLLFENNDIIV
jgi:hypothetical protein